MAADHHHGPTDGRADRGLRNRLLIAFGITALIVLTRLFRVAVGVRGAPV